MSVGIYIPGIKPPKNEAGAFKPIILYVGADGKLRAECEGTHEAVLVPPHGRLGDLEQAVIILERLRDHCGNVDMAYALNWAANSIRDLPTIIPGEEGAK